MSPWERSSRFAKTRCSDSGDGAEKKTHSLAEPGENLDASGQRLQRQGLVRIGHSSCGRSFAEMKQHTDESGASLSELSNLVKSVGDNLAFMACHSSLPHALRKSPSGLSSRLHCRPQSFQAPLDDQPGRDEILTRIYLPYGRLHFFFHRASLQSVRESMSRNE